MQRAIGLAQLQGARLVKYLPISVPAHCALMQPAVPALKQAIDAVCWQVPKIPVVSNVYSKCLNDITHIKMSLLEQLYQPVQWVNNVHALLDQGVECFIECGPGTVLASLVKRIVPASVTVTSPVIIQNFKLLL